MKHFQLTNLLNRLALLLFDLLARARGYRFVAVKTRKQEEDFYDVNREAGFSFPPDIQSKINRYKSGGVRFVAYYKNRPAGVVRLGDPKVANRQYGICGVDPAGEHFEIQSLVVGREFREGSQFVMMGLFRSMYGYSRRHDIASWISFSMRNVYLTMRRYSKDIRLIEVDFRNLPNPVGRYLYDNQVFDTCYAMQVESFSPWNILSKYFKYKTKNVELFSWIKIKRAGHESFNYGSK